MQTLSRRALLAGLAGVAVLPVAGCGRRRRERRRNQDPGRQSRKGEPPLFPNETPKLRRLINKYADLYDVPRPLVHRVVVRESTHNPAARNGPYWGLMQLLPETARTMGHRGRPKSLLDPETNLKYGVKYLRGAWLLSDGDYDTAVSWYARGYYYEAKRRGMLEETGLR